ncbi:hypothetical protein THAOC_24075, partial [Thalassiosira oceanica]
MAGKGGSRGRNAKPPGPTGGEAGRRRDITRAIRAHRGATEMSQAPPAVAMARGTRRGDHKVYGGKQAEEEVNQFYYRSGCCVEKTKVALLAALGVSDGNTVDLDMVIEKDDGVSLALQSGAESGASGAVRRDKGWVRHRLEARVETRGRTRARPRTVDDGACASVGLRAIVLFPRDEQHPARSRHEGRYFQRHKWVLNDARRVKLGAGSGRVQDPPGKSAISNRSNPRAVPPRYNGIRPVAAEYDSLRISKELYPDPSSFGWTFTGSNEKSR